MTDKSANLTERAKVCIGSIADQQQNSHNSPYQTTSYLRARCNLKFITRTTSTFSMVFLPTLTPRRTRRSSRRRCLRHHNNRA